MLGEGMLWGLSQIPSTRIACRISDQGRKHFGQIWVDEGKNNTLSADAPTLHG
jgi:hypothetical protein